MVGRGLIVTKTSSVLVQPQLGSVIVAVYVEFTSGVTFMLGVVAPVLHL